MIKVLSDYYDKKGRMCKVLSYNNGRFMCQFYGTGEILYLESKDLYDKQLFKQATVVEPVYYEEDSPVEEVYDFSITETQENQDNIKEKNQVEDIYSDFI